MSKEPAESDIMQTPPRPRTKVLVSNTLLAYSYTYAGILQTLGCFLAYCCVFWSHNINIADLWMSAIDSWQDGGALFTSNGRTFSVSEQLYIGRQACSAWHMGIVFGQFWHLFATRTRRQSIFTHGVFRNAHSNAALIIELILILIFVYCPGINEFIGGAPIPWTSWAVVAVVGWILILQGEVRKYFIRKYPQNSIVRLFKW
uniref:Cation-transporting P-type ATPase C-terminal domain-containing protein n=1 Tax=Panagrolaimus sp. ES5 TaxID=591445 RepID=A0AC34G273_9BILA